ncbi:hypothetical protein MMC27_008531 [Xylographa pallens]|nr:hypothetical protein [Xylographa pallens]
MDRRADSVTIQPPEEYDLNSLGDQDEWSQERSLLPTGAAKSYPQHSSIGSIVSNLPLWIRTVWRRPPVPGILRRGGLKQRPILLQFFRSLIAVTFSIVFLFSVFLSSPYVHFPAWYPHRGLSTAGEGSANPTNEKIFIAANIIDEGLIRGPWGAAVQDLVYLLGRSNVFLSVYENDSGLGTKAALEELRNKVTCDASIVSTTLPLSTIQSVNPPFIGYPVTRRITYLATLRNLALLPLTYSLSPTPGSPDAPLSSTSTAGYRQVPQEPSEYSKILFLNDVIFSPEEAAHLLFDTNGGNYSAACALDFINPVKFYDTFALRNTEGDGIGLPLYPFFTPGPSQSALISGSDSVPVKSCWGGMVAFEARFFTRRDSPVRFRSEQAETTRESSECCLVHADIDDAARTFVNPFVRVAYGPKTFSLLRYTKRFERLWYLPHKFLSWVVGMPWKNPRRDEKAGETFQDHGLDSQGMQRIARKGGFCSIKGLFLVRDSEDGVRKSYRFSLPSK